MVHQSGRVFFLNDSLSHKNIIQCLISQKWSVKSNFKEDTHIDYVWPTIFKHSEKKLGEEVP